MTAIAYFSAFAALATTPSTPFAVLSLVPLAASLLYLARAFNWHAIALFGLATTWGTCISRGSSDASLASTQALFLAYWLLFEAFDLLRVRKRHFAGGLEWIAPVNAMAFLWLSYMAWARHAPELLWLASAYGAALYLAGAVARAFLRPPSTFGSDELLARLRAGSYEGSLVLAAALAGLAIVGRVPGIWTSVGLALEAEILYVAGCRLRAPFLERMGRSAFVFSLVRLVASGWGSGQTVVLGHATQNWTPPALFHAFVFYANRLLRPSVLFSSAGAVLIAVVLAAEMPDHFVGASWLIFGAALFEVGIRKQMVEFRAQAYLLALGGVATTALLQTSTQADVPWQTLALALAITYSYAAQSRRQAVASIPADERTALAIAAAGATAALASILLWRVVPAGWLGLAWCLLSVALFEIGNRRFPSEMRLMFWPVAGLGAVGLIATHTADLIKFAGVEVWGSYLGAAMAACVVAVRVLAWRPAEMHEPERVIFAGAASASLAWMTLLWIVLPEPVVSLAWAGLAVAAVELGLWIGLRSFGWTANAIAAVVLVRAFITDLGALEYRLVAVVPVIVTLYWFAWRLASISTTTARVHCWAASFLGVV